MTQAMAYRAFDVNVKCVEGLNNKNMLLFNRRVYAVVSVVGSCRSTQVTPSGKFLSKYKAWEWDYPMRFHVQESMVQENRLMVVIRLRRSCRCFSRDKDIGEVYIPIKQLFHTVGSGLDNSGFGAYQVHSPSGKPKGYLKLWYKFNECSSTRTRSEVVFENFSRFPDSSQSAPSSEVAYQYQVLPTASSRYQVLPSPPPCFNCHVSPSAPPL